MSDIKDIPMMGAPQWVSTAINAPCFTGWTLQVLLCGIATDRALQLLWTRKGVYAGMPYAKGLYVGAVLMNALSGAMNFWSIVAWGGDQDRTFEHISAYKVPDIVSSCSGGLTAVLVQSFLAIRCWKILRKSRTFAVLISAAISAGLAGTIWITISSVGSVTGDDEDGLFVSTQIWLWCSVLVDLIITVCLVVHLSTLKQGFNARTDSVLGGLIRLAFETCAMPLLFATAGAIMYITTWRSPTLWNLCTVTIASIPSIYVLSMVRCQDATAVKSDTLGGPSADGVCLPKLHIDPAVSALGQRSCNGRSWEPPLEWGSVVMTPDDSTVKRPLFRRGSSIPFVTYSPSTKTVPLQSPTEGPTLFEDVERTAGGRAFLDVRVHVNREVTVEEKHAGETPEPRTSEKD